MTTAPSSSPTASPSTCVHPLRDLSVYTTTTFVPALDAHLADKSAVLSVPIDDLLCLAGPDQIENFCKLKFDQVAPSRVGYIGDILSLLGPGAIGGKIALTAFRHVAANVVHARKRNPVVRNLSSFTVTRPVVSLTEKERGLMRGAGALTANHLYTPEQWSRFLALLTWNGGKGTLEPTPALAANARMPEVRAFVAELLTHLLPEHGAFLNATAADIATHARSTHRIAPALSQAIAEGAHWMTPQELASSPYYTTEKTPGGLLIGHHPETGQRIFFPSHESLITIGGPGSGKSQCQVIPNLLRYPGSAIVLDVKGELWDLTAGWRAKHVGPVYRFAPTDPTGATHRYNPFDAIPAVADQAANDCAVFSYQVVADNPKLTDPYWESKGRDFLWAFAMLVALRLKSPNRTIEALAELVSLPLDADPDSDISILADAMQQLGRRDNIPDLVSAGSALKSGLGSSRLESVIDTARRHLAPFARSASFRNAMSASDWTPQQLRTQPGTTVYICLSAAELKTFAPIVRLILTQHARILQQHRARPDEVPITFFLDEMPQLGNFESILEVQDLGRGAGLRLWMFAQSLGQLAQAFGQHRYRGIVDACRVRSFLQPDAEAARLIEPALGQVNDLITGEKRPLATAFDLMGRAFHDRTIVTTRGDLPMTLAKRYAWQSMPHRLLPPPPVPRP